MKVKMKTLMAGPYGIRQPEEEIEVSKKDAKDLISGGFAKLIEEPEEKVKAEPEATSIEQPETTSKPAAAKRKNPPRKSGKRKS